MKIVSVIRITIIFFLIMTIITGFIYPLVMTGFAQLLFPFQANGSLIKDGDIVRGSRLIDPGFTGDQFFHGRPSAASHSTVPSGASNLSPIGKKIKPDITTRQEEWQKQYEQTIPPEMLYTSGSGLDPDISIEAALLQVDRVSAARNLTGEQKTALISYIKNNPLARELFPSPARINIIELNRKLETDRQFGMKE